VEEEEEALAQERASQTVPCCRDGVGR
jgi:hypothetical protein